MKKFNLFIFLIIFNFIYCGSETEIRKKYYNNGQIKSKTTYIKDTNIRHGEWIIYYPNGNIARKGILKDGEFHGESIKYYENGKIMEKQPFKDGKIHGEVIYYYENGNIRFKETYKDGKKIK